MRPEDDHETMLHIYEQQYVQASKEAKEQLELRNRMLVLLRTSGRSEKELCERLNRARAEANAPAVTRHTVAMVLRRFKKDLQA